MNKYLKLLTIGLLTSGFIVNNYAMEATQNYAMEVDEDASNIEGAENSKKRKRVESTEGAGEGTTDREVEKRVKQKVAPIKFKSLMEDGDEDGSKEHIQAIKVFNNLATTLVDSNWEAACNILHMSMGNLYKYSVEDIIYNLIVFNKNTALKQALGSYKYTCFKNAISKCGRDLLLQAIGRSNLQSVKILLDNGVFDQLDGDSRFTILKNVVVLHKNCDMLRFLLNYKVKCGFLKSKSLFDANSVDSNQNNLAILLLKEINNNNLSMDELFKRVEIINILSGFGLCLDHKNNQDETVYSLSKENSQLVGLGLLDSPKQYELVKQLSGRCQIM